jgi:dsRNA-specific ribonuclease
LQERAQKTYQQLPVYTEEAVQVESSGNILTYRSVVLVADKVLAEAIAGNKRKAQEEAARLAYTSIEKNMII